MRAGRCLSRVGQGSVFSLFFRCQKSYFDCRNSGKQQGFDRLLKNAFLAFRPWSEAAGVLRTKVVSKPLCPQLFGLRGNGIQKKTPLEKASFFLESPWLN